jgi:hypothetical protein
MPPPEFEGVIFDDGVVVELATHEYVQAACPDSVLGTHRSRLASRPLVQGELQVLQQLGGGVGRPQGFPRWAGGQHRDRGSIDVQSLHTGLTDFARKSVVVGPLADDPQRSSARVTEPSSTIGAHRQGRALVGRARDHNHDQGVRLAA